MAPERLAGAQSSAQCAAMDHATTPKDPGSEAHCSQSKPELSPSTTHLPSVA